MSLNHEKLVVYQRALSFNAGIGIRLAEWDSRHCLCDHLSRAGASIVENLAMASATQSATRRRMMDYAIGSTLECAACLDLARVKRLLDQKAARSEKAELSEILRMLVGLRRAWDRRTGVVKEEGMEYGDGDKVSDKVNDEVSDDVSDKVLFHHETLDVYRVALEAARAMASSAAVERLPRAGFHRLDELLTSMVLNIAEGNGRFSAADQRRFLGTSHEAAIKLASRLDVCVAQGLLAHEEVAAWKGLLERVALMTWAMTDHDIAGQHR